MHLGAGTAQTLMLLWCILSLSALSSDSEEAWLWPAKIWPLPYWSKTSLRDVITSYRTSRLFVRRSACLL